MVFLDLDWHSSILKTVLMHPEETGLSKTNLLCGIGMPMLRKKIMNWKLRDTVYYPNYILSVKAGMLYKLKPKSMQFGTIALKELLLFMPTTDLQWLKY